MNSNFVLGGLTPDVTLEQVLGSEALTLVENFSVFYNRLSLNIDKGFAKMSSTIHKVDYQRALVNSKKLNYFKINTTEVPISEFFNQTNTNWEGYVNGVLNVVRLLVNIKSEIGSMYTWIKEIASSGKVGYSFRYNISGLDNLIDQTRAFIESAGAQSTYRRAQLNMVYPSFDKMFKLIDDYNKNVSLIKARDMEIISKELDQIKRMGDLTIAKIKAGDIRPNEEQIHLIATSFDNFSKSITILGAGIGLVNELMGVLKAQCDVIATL